MRVTIPPLRERPEDIVPIAQTLLCAARGDPGAVLPPELASVLAGHAWPGNVRELKNVIEMFVALGATQVRRELSAQPSGHVTPLERPFHEARQIVLDRFERQYIEAALERAGGVVAHAAERADLARPSLYRMMQRLKIEPR